MSCPAATLPDVEAPRRRAAVAADERGYALDLTRLPGVGKAAAKSLAALGLHTVDDLLHHLPRRYLQRGQLTPLRQVREGERVAISARVLSADLREMRSRRGALLVCRVTDGERSLDLTFFGRHRGALAFHQRTLVPGSVHFFSGTVGSYRGNLQLTHPEFEPAEEVSEEDFLRPVPVYPATGALATWTIARLVRAALALVDAEHPASTGDGADADDLLPAAYRASHGLATVREAFELVHRPASDADPPRGREVLAHEEALVLQTALAVRRHVAREEVARPRPPQPGGLREAFEKRLPFELTPGQKSVGLQLQQDLGSPVPMLRLLQGDVGAGKTVVALRAMLQVVDAGGQAVLLAPTEVLVHQHRRSIEDLLGPLAQAGMLGGAETATRVVALTGSLGARQRRRALAEIASGAAGIVVGTHALFSQDVMFDDLGLVVVDEQHRFGVEQREVLRNRGETTPHLLHMTATPIPRTIAMTVFGDLDVTDLPGLPSGRQPVATHLVDAGNQRWVDRAWQRAAEEVAAGGRVFVVCPRITPDEPEDDRDAAEGVDPLEPAGPDGTGAGADGSDDDLLGALGEGGADGAGSHGDRVLHTVLGTRDALAAHPALAGIAVGAMHGRMSAEEKDAAMAAFVDGTTPVLVSTTVIEVGVDVPDATLMIVLDADRFGLAQLHQLRGRVGRGTRPSVCLALHPGDLGATTMRRLAAFASTADGFELADLDLELRAEGDVLGAEQSGRRSSLAVLSLSRHADVIAAAREAARELVAADPDLGSHPALAAALAHRVDEDTAHWLGAT